MAIFVTASIGYLSWSFSLQRAALIAQASDHSDVLKMIEATMSKQEEIRVAQFHEIKEELKTNREAIKASSHQPK